MNILARVQRSLSRTYTSLRTQSVWTPENVVKSPYPDVEIPNVTLSEYIWRDLDKWPDTVTGRCGHGRKAVRSLNLVGGLMGCLKTTNSGLATSLFNHQPALEQHSGVITEPLLQRDVKSLQSFINVCGITNRSYTYNKLYKCCRNFAASLRKHFKINDGDVVAIMMPNAPEYPIAVIGAIQAGAAVTTINPVHTVDEVNRQLRLSEPKIIIATPETIFTIKEGLRMAKTKIPVIVVKNPQDGLPPETISFEELIENHNIDKSVLNNVKTRQEDVVLLPYSSGTTGLPKGVELTNRNKVVNFAQQEVDGVKHYIKTTNDYQDSVLGVVPFFHIYGLSVALLHNLVIGSKIVTLPRFQPSTFLNAFKEHKTNLLYAAPPLALFLGTHPDVKKEQLASLDRLVCGAAPISKSDIRRVLDKCQPNLKFIQIYGLSEVSPFATSMIPGSHDHTTVGFALPNSELRVVDVNDRNLGPDEVGELHIRGPHVMKGYRDNPEATKTAITDDGWFRTGDLVSINRDGAVTIVDRIKELIKVKGFQVAPAELEGILKEHPDVLDAGVIGIPDDRKGEAPKAFVVLKKGHITTATNIKEFVSKKVAEYKRLKDVEFTDALPKNLSGKLLRRILKEKG